VTNSDLRPLSVGEILDRTFSLYRQHFLLFVGIVALPQLAIVAINLTRLLLHGGQIGRAVNAPPVSLSRAFSPPDVALTLVILLAIYGLFYPFASGGLAFAASELYFGRATTIGASLRRSWSQLGKVTSVVLASLVASSAGLVLLLVPGVYVACRLIASVPVAVLENLGTRDTLKRSLTLTKDNAGRSFVIYLLYYCLGITASGLLVYPFTYAAGLYEKETAMVLVWQSLGQVAAYFVAIFMHPVIAISATLFYYDLRVRKEALDLQLMINQVGGTARRTAGASATLT
jgi:Membrane domain of glycerophosphoryl diester phosphodiesterase